MNKVRVYCENEKYKKDIEKLKKITKKSLNFLKKEGLCVDVFLVNSQQIRALNKKFNKKNKPANVLSFLKTDDFPYPELGKGYSFIGEIYLSPDFILRQKEDIKLMLIHGLLHLLGYTHFKNNDKIKMENMEIKLLCQL